MDFPSLQLGLDIATSISILTAGAMYVKDSRNKKKEQDEQRNKELEQARARFEIEYLKTFVDKFVDKFIEQRAYIEELKHLLSGSGKALDINTFNEKMDRVASVPAELIWFFRLYEDSYFKILTAEYLANSIQGNLDKLTKWKKEFNDLVAMNNMTDLGKHILVLDELLGGFSREICTAMSLRLANPKD